MATPEDALAPELRLRIQTLRQKLEPPPAPPGPPR